jgi:hypothetical protein
VKESPFRAELVHIRRNPWIMGLAALPFAGTLALLVLGLFSPVFLLMVPHTIALGAVTTIHAWRRNFRPLTPSYVVTADARGLTVGPEFVPRSAIRGGLVNPGDGVPRVLLRRRFDLPLELQAGSTDEARGLLRALGLDVSQIVAEFRTPSRLLDKRRYGAVFGLFMVMFAVVMSNASRMLSGYPYATGLTVAVFMSCLFSFVLLMLIPSRLRVGADGIEIRWLRWRNFLAYDHIMAASREERGWGNSQVVGLRVELGSGDTQFIPVQRGRWSSDQAALVLERIREAKEAVKDGDVAVDAAMLQRGSLTIVDWVRDLKAIGMGANATLRTAPVPRERLMRIVEDVSQPAPTRAAAAVALGGALDDDDRARLRVVAESTVAPKLRLSIEKAASDEDDDAIGAALAEVDADVRMSRRAR